MSAPLNTQDDLDKFAMRTKLTGHLVFTKDITGLLPTQTADLLTESKLRKLGGGDTRVTTRVVYGPAGPEEFERRAKSMPYAIIKTAR